MHVEMHMTVINGNTFFILVYSAIPPRGNFPSGWYPTIDDLLFMEDYPGDIHR